MLTLKGHSHIRREQHITLSRSVVVVFVVEDVAAEMDVAMSGVVAAAGIAIDNATKAHAPYNWVHILVPLCGWQWRVWRSSSWRMVATSRMVAPCGMGSQVI